MVLGAGNNSQYPLQLIMTAASQGALVGKMINSELLYEDLGLMEGGTSTQAPNYLDHEREQNRENGKERPGAGRHTQAEE
jgi:hypothetical protein